MSRCFAWISVLAVILAGVHCEVAYRWDKTRILPQMGYANWRATSFALTQDKVFLSLVDIQKQTPGNGVMGAFNISTMMSPDVSLFPFQNFYKMSDPERGRISTPMSVRTDKCERLWLLDSAIQNISGTQIKTSPGIYVFNTKTSQLMRSFNIPMSQWSIRSSFFVNFVVSTVSTEHDCEESFGYFADFNRFHILSYDFLRNRSALKSHAFFSPSPLVHIPDEALFNRGQKDLNGVYGLALVDQPNTTKYLYFHPLASTHEFRINTQKLKSEDDLKYSDVEIYKDKGENTESGCSVFDSESNTIFFAELNTRNIGALRLKSDPKDVPYYRYDLNLTSGVIVDLNVHNSELWVLVDDMSQITVHRVPVLNITEKVSHHGHEHHDAPHSSASHIALNLGSLVALTLLCLFSSS